MKKAKICFVGWMIYSGLDLFGFTTDVLMGVGGSGHVYEKFWLFSLIFASPIIFAGTIKYLFLILPRRNKIILIILSLIATFIQIIVLMGILFFIAIAILSPLLANLGFYITMP